jgi:hypothetical protein
MRADRAGVERMLRMYFLQQRFNLQEKQNRFQREPSVWGLFPLEAATSTTTELAEFTAQVFRRRSARR